MTSNSKTIKKCGQCLVAAAMSVLCAQAAENVTEVTLPGDHFYPESLTSLKDGTLIVGSVGQGDVSRIPYNSTDVTEWIKPGTNGLHAVYGVYADEKRKTLWVCSDKNDAGEGSAEAKTFDLATGAPKGNYPLPGVGFCNDFAIAANGTAYVSDTRQATILMLKPGAKALEPAAQDPLLAGADGLAFGQKNVLYVNSVTTGKLVRVNLGSDGKSTGIVDLTLSQPLSRPDGMRAIGKNRMLMAENAGNMDIVTIGADGKSANIKAIKQGLEAAPAVTATRGMAWIAEGKLNYRTDPALKGKSPAPFDMYAVPLPAK